MPKVTGLAGAMGQKDLELHFNTRKTGSCANKDSQSHLPCTTSVWGAMGVAAQPEWDWLPVSGILTESRQVQM